MVLEEGEMMMNISELQKRVHETAVLKGWHDRDNCDHVGFGAWLIRLATRLARPWRRGLSAAQKLAWLALVTDELDEAESEEEALYYGPEGKPEGRLIEIVDAMIRLLDMAGACGWSIRVDAEDNPNDYDISSTRSGLVGAIRTGECNQGGHANALFLALIAELERERREATSEEGKPPTVEELFALKDAYNRTREWRHGGKLA